MYTCRDFLTWTILPQAETARTRIETVLLFLAVDYHLRAFNPDAFVAG